VKNPLTEDSFLASDLAESPLDLSNAIHALMSINATFFSVSGDTLSWKWLDIKLKNF
jgi:hypothetical protein